jgi:hypothetical protein
MNELHPTATGNWKESRPFHGDDARERASEWVRSETTKVIDGVDYFCTGGDLVFDEGSVLATRNWCAHAPGVLEWSHEYKGPALGAACPDCGYWPNKGWRVPDDGCPRCAEDYKHAEPGCT